MNGHTASLSTCAQALVRSKADSDRGMGTREQPAQRGEGEAEKESSSDNTERIASSKGTEGTERQLKTKSTRRKHFIPAKWLIG